VDRIKLTLKRRFVHKGEELSYLNAGCPAPSGTHIGVFPLARATLGFSGQTIEAVVNKNCRVKE
jgi:hypothetical protein